MKNYFGENITCIYLDQFAASNIFDNSNSSTWKTVADLFIEKAKNGRIICPIPFEHFLESAKKDRQRALGMNKLFFELARGFGFRPEIFTTAYQIISVVRNMPFDKDVFFDELQQTKVLSKSEVFEQFSSNHDLFTTQIEEATTGKQEIRDILNEKRFPKSVLEPVFQALKLQQISYFTRRLDELISTGKFISRGVAFSTGEIIDWPDFLLQALVWRHQLTLQEAIYLGCLINDNGFNLFPTLDIRISLTALWTCERKKEGANDHIDLMRLATGIPASDIVFADKQRKHELIDSGLAAKYNAEVFSGSEADLQAFLSRLSDL